MSRLDDKSKSVCVAESSPHSNARGSSKLWSGREEGLGVQAVDVPTAAGLLLLDALLLDAAR